MPTQEAGVVGDRYVLGPVIGRGGMADVYRAQDRVLHRPVAVKIMRDIAGDPRERARFAAEAQTLARLNHPGLVPVWDAGVSDDRPFLVMELIEGPTLADCCRGVALQPTRVAAIGAELATALAYVHASGVVHRDVKPGNVLLDTDDRVRLTDFGIARLVSDTSGHTATGTTIGTAAYLAPEQVRGERVSAAADVYSLGLVLLEALTGQRTYQGSPMEAALARLTKPPHIPDALPGRWRSLLEQMMSLDETLRPTADQVAATLRELAAGEDPGAATAVLRNQSPATRVLTAPEHVGDVATPAGGGTRRWHDVRTRLLSRPVHAAAAAAVLVVLLLSGLLLTGGSSAPPGGTSDIPADTPSRFREPLTDLHDAVKEGP